MRAWCASRISDNLAETPEGYLLCLNVPLCRVGVQYYAGSEVGSNERRVAVTRTAEEVLSDRHIATLEGKAVCHPHPAMFLTPGNTHLFQKGHCQNVRRSKLADGTDCLIGDLLITDGTLIQQIKSGMLRQVSTGYDCTYEPIGANGWMQTQLQANHIAIVSAGRAGPQVAIQDGDSLPPSAEDFAAMAKQFHRKGVVGVQVKAPATGPIYVATDHGIEGAMDGEVILEGPKRPLTVKDLETKFDAIIDLDAIIDQLEKLEAKEAAAPRRRAPARAVSHETHEVRVARMREDQFDRRVVAEFYGDAHAQDFAAQANRLGRKMRRQADGPVAQRTQAARDSEEHWADQLNRVGAEMRGR
jgi:hypothetical protein